jgi:nitrite reductase/ring-hydroxylating ferredoxin subunit
MPDLVSVGPFDALALGHGAAVLAGQGQVALFRLDDVVYAIEAWCLRCGASLAEGQLRGRVLACRGCDWHYDVASGCVIGVPALRLQTFATHVIDGQVVLTDA